MPIIPKKKPKKKPNKFGAIKTVYKGNTYDSKKEANYAQRLDLLMRSNHPDRPISWERQVKMPIEIKGKHIFNYFLDFRVKYHNRVEFVDVKGVKTDVYKIKKKAIEAYYNIKIKEV